MTRDDYLQWRNDQVTQEAFEVIAQAATQVASDLINSTHSDPALEMYKKGFIKGIQEFMGWQPIFDEEKALEEALLRDEEDDEIQDDGP